MRLRTLLVVAIVMCVGGAAHGGVYVPPVGDYAPTWSPDASAIVFYRGSLGLSGELWVVDADGTGARRLPVPGSEWYALSPDWHWLAVPAYRDGNWVLTVLRPDGTDPHEFGRIAFGSRPSWSPDGRRLAFQQADGIYVANADGTDLRRIAAHGHGPVWSPRGDRIAFVGGTVEYPSIEVVTPDGGRTDEGLAFEGFRIADDLEWSPDGEQLAYASGRPGDAFREIEAHSIDDNDPASDLSWKVGVPVTSFRWSRDGKHIAFASTSAGVIDVAGDDVTRLGKSATDVDWAPDARRLAITTTGECRDRSGIESFSLDTRRFERLTNGCRIYGTRAADRLRGTTHGDVIFGLGGNDALAAVASPFTGDTVFGGSGNDSLRGSGQSDTLDGGPGADTLTGGPGADVLRGGPGRDVLRAGGGSRDVVHAEDGQRDVVSCGTNASQTTAPAEQDIAYADRIDRVGRDCEYVYRASAPTVKPGARLTIVVLPQGRANTTLRRSYTLRCKPAGGTLPHPGAACAKLASIQNPFAPVPPDVACSQIYGGPQLATVVGAYAGKRVRTTFTRSDGCQIARWNRVKFLFPIPLAPA